MQLQYMLYY